MAKTDKCPLCGSRIGRSKYYEIIGIWEERKRLEESLRQEKQDLQKEKLKMEKEKKRIMKEAFEKGKVKEKARSERLSKMLQNRMGTIQEQNKKIKELQEQLKKGTTPQIEGLNLEEELVKELRNEFTDDKIEHHGKDGDIVHRVIFKNKQAGIILYECKKTSKFNSAFIDQTKKAMVSRQATYGVLVTTVFKRDTAGFYVEKDILIVHPYGAVYIAKVLRNSIIEIYSSKISQREIEKRSKEMMEYIKSDEFKNSVGDSIYRTRALYEMLKKEMRSHEGIWKDRYRHYKAIHDNVSLVELVTSNIRKGLPAKEAMVHLRLRELPPPVVAKEK